MYEIWTASRPYQNEPDDIVEENYKCRCFPDVGTLPVADIIEKCWHGTYNSADEVVADLTLLQTELAALVSIITTMILAAWFQLTSIVTSFPDGHLEW